MVKKGIKVIFIEKNSLAEKAGISKGSVIFLINNKPVNDKLDFIYNSSSLNLILLLSDPYGNQRKIKIIKKSFEEDIGIEVEDFSTKRCMCNCIFCFINQMPKGLRKDLYIKDEDYRLSFFHGNYITGINLTKADLLKISKLRLSPLYLSVHTSNKDLRKKMLCCKGDTDIFPLLTFLKKNGIRFHTQIVLCPGINDGNELFSTIKDLLKFYPYLLSIAVVPVGLTKHRNKLPKLKSADKRYSNNLLDFYIPFKKKIKKKYDDEILFFSDEFYLLADKEPPLYKDLEEFPQLENGIGMYADFYRNYAKTIKKLPMIIPKKRKIGVLTSLLGYKSLNKVIKDLSGIKNLTILPIIVENKLFGKSVTVTGLLSGNDILDAIKSNPGCTKYLLPGNCLKYPDKVFLDDLSFKDLEKLSASNVEIINNGVEEFIFKCLNN